MGYSICKFGALYVGDKPQHIPCAPRSMRDIPDYDGISTIHLSFDAPTPKNRIIWIKPDGMNLLISDRVLLTGVSWNNLRTNGFCPKEQAMDGGAYGQFSFRCRLLDGGDVYDAEFLNEWDNILNATTEDDSCWHWQYMYSWCNDVAFSDSSTRVVRGHESARFRDYCDADNHYNNVGFRPVLEILPAFGLIPNVRLDGQEFSLTNLPGSKDFYPILQPKMENAFTDIPDGQESRMYTLLKDGKPVRMDINRRRTFKNATQLELTDRYFGDEYLIPWTISNGVAVASHPLLQKALANKKAGS